MNALLSVQALNAGYGEAVVLNDVSFDLQAGQTLALLGRNGVGKSTLIESIVGTTTHHGGDLSLAGESMRRWPAYRRAAAGIGWVPQERNIFKSLTVEENLTAVMRPARFLHADRRSGSAASASAAWDLTRIYGLFPRLAERCRQMGGQLSGGEQQMLAVGRALALNPRLLLLDEPFEGLAPIIIEDLSRAIQAITRGEGLTAIIVEQHPNAVLAISDQALILDQGRVVHFGAARALLDDPVPLAKHLGAVGQS